MPAIVSAAHLMPPSGGDACERGWGDSDEYVLPTHDIGYMD